MKILNIVSKGFAHGGAEQLILEVNAALLANGDEVRTFASDLGADKEHFNTYTFRGMHAFSFTAGTPVSQSPLPLQYALYPFKLLFFLFNFSSFFALKKVLAEYQPDLVHLHTMVQVTPSVLFLLKKYPTVMTLWGPETFLSNLLLWCLTPADFKRPSDTLYPVYKKEELNAIGKSTYFFFQYVQKPLYRWGLKNVDVFLAPSAYIQRIAEADASPIIHVPPFTELQPFYALTKNYNLLFVGRLVNVKGIEFLIQAMPRIYEAFPQAKLTIVGDGFGRASLVNLAKCLQLEMSVQFVGFVEHQELGPYYEESSIVVIPSTWPENFPTVCSEAMSAGRPVIGTKVGGIPEMIDDGVTGYLIEPGNPEHIAEKVIALFSNEDIFRRFGKNARQKAEQLYSKENYVRDLQRIYEEVVNNYRQPPAAFPS